MRGPVSTPSFRAWMLHGLADTIAAMGGDVAAYAERFQLPLMRCESDTTLPAERLVRLMEACARDLDCPDFGLRAGFMQGRGPLGPIALVALNCATVGEAVEAIARYLNLLTSLLSLQMVRTSTGPRLAYELKALRMGSTVQFEQWALAVGLRMFRLIVSDQSRPKAMLFPHAPLLPLARYRDFFGCTVKFSQPAFGVDLFAADLRRAIVRNDPELKHLLSDYIEKMAGTAPLALRDEVELMVRKLLPTARCNVATVAGHMHVSVRTLQRQLALDGLVFEEVLDGVRRQAAELYLLDPAVRMSQVAGLLGYTAASSFSHAFRRWHGMSPRAWRQAHGAR